jgi:DNA-binding transcriptional ArsR family regulator
MLQELFISEVRIKVLKLLLLRPDKSYHVRAIVRAVDAEINAVRRELEKLYKINLLRRRQSSNRLYYSVNTSHMFYPELISLLAKEHGLGAEIIKHAKDLGDVKFAMLSRAFLRGRESTALDVDLFLVGNINLDMLERIVKEYQRKKRREINYSTMTEEEFMFRKRKHDHFIVNVLTQSRTMLIGDEEKFYSVV